MKTLSIREARHAFSHLDRLLIKEDEVIITRHGKPVAKLMRIKPKRPIPSHRNLRNSMTKITEGSEVAVRQDRNAR
jgi:antitoxin (DNA-binding transcriptional repressor) of toxin-antitoxin stability system